jgi:hypothetical protein
MDSPPDGTAGRLSIHPSLLKTSFPLCRSARSGARKTSDREEAVEINRGRALPSADLCHDFVMNGILWKRTDF